MSFGQSAVGLARAAARLLGWRPHEFWSATPAELATALGGDTAQALSRADLTRLMEQET